MNGYPYQRLAKPMSAKTPAATDVGAMLAQRFGGMGAVDPQAIGNPQMGAMAAQGMENEPGEGPAHEMAEGPAYEGQEDMMEGESPMGASPMGGMVSPMAQAMMTRRLPAQGMAGDYDPTMEHSPSATRIALEQAALRMMGKMTGSETRITPSNTREVLTRLGIPPLEIQLMEQTGQFGDTAGG